MTLTIGISVSQTKCAHHSTQGKCALINYLAYYYINMMIYLYLFNFLLQYVSLPCFLNVFGINGNGTPL